MNPIPHNPKAGEHCPCPPCLAREQSLKDRNINTMRLSNDFPAGRWAAFRGTLREAILNTPQMEKEGTITTGETRDEALAKLDANLQRLVAP